MEPALHIAIVFDDERDRRRFADYLGPRKRVHQVAGGDELLQLASSGTIDVAVCGVINRNDDFLADALRELSFVAPHVGIVGVFEPSPPSLAEAVDLIREIPGMGLVSRPGARFDYLARGRVPGALSPTFSGWLLDCIDRMPVFGAAHRFALLQALHPSCAANIPEQAQDLGMSRRNLERWFQGPDLCSPGCFQSVCGAAEAAYLRLVLDLPARDVALAVGILTREGVENPQAVPRTIRNSLRAGLDELRDSGVQGLVDSVESALRTSRDPVKAPAQWEPDTRFVPEPGALAVPMDGGVLVMSPSRQVQHPLDQFGVDAWRLLARGVTFADLVTVIAEQRGEPQATVRNRLIVWLGEMLVLRLIRRERHLKAANGD